MTFNATLGSPLQTALIRVEAFDAAIGDRLDTGTAAALITADKQKLLMTGTLFWDSIRWLGTRLWPGSQRLSWPRVSNLAASLEVDLRSTYESVYRGPLDRYAVGGQVDGAGTTTVSAVAAVGGNPQNYPDDYFNEGSIRVTSTGTNFYEVRTITDFVAATGTITHAAFTGATAGQSVEVVPPLHPKVIAAFVELCVTLAREKSGYSDRKKRLAPEILATRIADRMMGSYVRKVFDLV